MRFRILLVDPPWLYDDARDRKSAGMALSAYPCLPTAEICALPVPDLADDRCMLCLWATGPKLPDAFRVIAAWGFAYTSVLFAWVKARPRWEGWDPGLREADLYSGLGHYTNSNVEYLLGGRKGRYWREARNVKQVIVAPRGAHSAKPPEARERIVRLFGDKPRAELFSREISAGWVPLGNHFDNKDIRQEIGEVACRASAS